MDSVNDAPSTRAFELAAHYGIPQSLPTPPRANLRTPANSAQPSYSDMVPDFEALRQSYLNMLSSTPSENPTLATVTESSSARLSHPATSTTVPTTIGSQTNDSSLQPILDLIEASPEFKMANSFLTSPYTPYMDDFDSTPVDDSPFVADLNTPIMDHIDNIEYGVVDSSSWMNDDAVSPLFNEANLLYYAQPPAQPENKKQTQQQPSAEGLLHNDKLYTFSPSSPFLDSLVSPPTRLVRSPVIHPTSTLYSSPRVPTTASFKPSPAVTSRSRSKSRGPSLSATGTRRDITPASMVSLDAPTQNRNYILPSSTSRKVNPVHAQKRSHSKAFGDQELDELIGETPPGPNATEIEHIEWKRRQNTIAARKTRRRKLEYLQHVEVENTELREDRDRWKVRYGVLEGVLKANGMVVPVWDDE
ncbi:hypothetical protein F5890DRAFT_1500810 [Lentinula detonsa]|uniref:BZIP domain-containing protein n=1 Tax=Lentinula detonsa TaxID=2804962 RepID=A0AA38Q4K5_9AGAR|nr:hypothetical protein F5890DRAFT_1500810 [Lentinula detonsa]